MKRTWPIWASFGLCAAVLAAGMGWVTLTAVKLDRARAEARHQAALEESVRLALWRMDSALSALLARESARPYFSYSAFSPAERAYTRMFAEIRRGDVMVPSPLLTSIPEHVLLHFQFGPDGEMTSPQVPVENMRDLAEAAYRIHDRIQASSAQLGNLQALVSRDDLLPLLPEEERAPAEGHLAPLPLAKADMLAAPQQAALNAKEWLARAQSFQQAQTASVSAPGVAVGPVVALWAGDALLLARRVTVNDGAYVQGCRLDWPAIRRWLLTSIADLLPQADLVPSPPGSAEQRARMLAALPVRLVPGGVPEGAGPPGSPTRLTLLLAWAAALLAGLAVAVLLRGAVALSQRRADFVSAVTHELRTPLTTFRMYTEMLAEGMVSDEPTRSSYVSTLQAEADRLAHLVENVFAYARLERGRPHGTVENVELGPLIEGMGGRLSQRAAQAGMEIVTSFAEGAAQVRVRVSATAIEQVLLNLVDNACKYAASAADRRIQLDVSLDGGRATVRLRDHGPGIPQRDVGRIFQPFRKSAHPAAKLAPGVGLGLALSRRLAEDMGGRLVLAASDGNGACFVLTLPLVTDAATGQ